MKVDTVLFDNALFLSRQSNGASRGGSVADVIFVMIKKIKVFPST